MPNAVLHPKLIMAESQEPGFIAALEEARAGAAEGGTPIGACLVSKDGKILGRGHNMRVQKGSAILHVSDPPRMVLTEIAILLNTSRRRWRQLRMAEDLKGRHTKEGQCIPLYRLAICAPERASTTR